MPSFIVEWPETETALYAPVDFSTLKSKPSERAKCKLLSASKDTLNPFLSAKSSNAAFNAFTELPSAEAAARAPNSTTFPSVVESFTALNSPAAGVASSDNLRTLLSLVSTSASVALNVLSTFTPMYP